MEAGRSSVDTIPGSVVTYATVVVCPGADTKIVRVEAGKVLMIVERGSSDTIVLTMKTVLGSIVERTCVAPWSESGKNVEDSVVVNGRDILAGVTSTS